VAVQEVGKKSNAPRFIVVEGPIGVGKTSLATRLADSFSAELVLEQADQNPFLEQFYRSRRAVALPAQLFFLFQRARQLQELRQSDMFAPVRIADFHIGKDRLFAELNLSRDEMGLYDQIVEQVDVEMPEPDLVVYLQASVDALMTRIARRSAAHEKMIDRAYIEELADAYARYFHRYDEAPLLIVNTSSIDPVTIDAEYDALLEQVSRITGGRHFFNPAADLVFA